jgi:hypothetical protein
LRYNQANFPRFGAETNATLLRVSYGVSSSSLLFQRAAKLARSVVYLNCKLWTLANEGAAVAQ